MIVEENWYLEYQPGEWYLLGMLGPGYATGPYPDTEHGPVGMAHRIVPFDVTHTSDPLLRRLVRKAAREIAR